jgi:hypothetical protein
MISSHALLDGLSRVQMRCKWTEHLNGVTIANPNQLGLPSVAWFWTSQRLSETTSCLLGTLL